MVENAEFPKYEQSNTRHDELHHPVFLYDTAEMTSSEPGPGHFCGRVDEDGQSWLATFELWLRFRSINGERKAAALALHLKDSAAAWYQSLADNRRDTYDNLRAAFVERYGTARLQPWQRAGLAWTIEQQPTQTVDDYMVAVLNAGRDAGLTDQQLVNAVIKGLRPSIRQYVIRQQPTDIDELRAAATLAEQTEFPPTTTPSSTDAIAATVARLENQLKQLTVAALAGRQQRSPSPLRRRESPPPPVRRPSADYDYTNDRQYYRHYDSLPDRRRVRFSDSYASVPSVNAADQQQIAFRPCDSCGRRNHPRHMCRFRGATCANCLRVGHLASVCRAANRQE